MLTTFFATASALSFLKVGEKKMVSSRSKEGERKRNEGTGSNQETPLPNGTSRGPSFDEQLRRKLVRRQKKPWPSGRQTLMLFLGSSDGSCPDIQDPVSNSEQVRESLTRSYSLREASSTENNQVKRAEKDKEGGNCSEQAVVRQLSAADKLSLQDVARESIDVIAERMRVQPEELLDELKSELGAILEEIDCSDQKRGEFLILKKLVQGRTDLTTKILAGAHRVHLEMLVAIKTNIQAYLLPNPSLSQIYLIEILVDRRCGNITCQSPFPAPDDCSCEICTSKMGFCRLCMCVICSGFDLEVHTCCWIGCDLCSHWTHTDCAILGGQIGMGPSADEGGSGPDQVMVFKCQSCHGTCELLGWLKDVFRDCWRVWDREAKMRAVDIVSRIFRGSKNPSEKELFWKCENILEKLNGRIPESTLSQVVLPFFQVLGIDYKVKNPATEKGGRKLIATEEACHHEPKDEARESEQVMTESKQQQQLQIAKLESIVMRQNQAQADKLDAYAHVIKSLMHRRGLDDKAKAENQGNGRG